MLGLTVRWSLENATDGVEEELAAYVADTSHAKFTGMPGLAQTSLALAFLTVRTFFLCQ